jgi:hypothetical protein
MAENKYANLVTQLKFVKGRGGANAKELVFVGGDQLSGFNLNFIIGVYDTVGDWAPDMGAHTHPFDECLLFFGYDDKDLNVLGSDMSLCVGKEYEKHYFSVPTVAAAPANLPHCPLVTEKVYQRFGHFHLALASKYAGGKAEKEGTTNGKKYNSLFKTMKAKPGAKRSNAAQVISVEGPDVSGIPINFNMSLCNKTGDWNPGKSSFMHPYDSVLVFFGHKTEDLSYLGAEISLAIGPEKEKYTFDKPTAVALPKGTPYSVVNCSKLEKPYGVMQIGLAAKYKRSEVK